MATTHSEALRNEGFGSGTADAHARLMRNHDQRNHAGVWRVRANLFRGLYDHRPRNAFTGAHSGYRLLNGLSRDEDATSRRFANIEIDDDRLG